MVLQHGDEKKFSNPKNNRKHKAIIFATLPLLSFERLVLQSTIATMAAAVAAATSAAIAAAAAAAAAIAAASAAGAAVVSKHEEVEECWRSVCCLCHHRDIHHLSHDLYHSLPLTYHKARNPETLSTQNTGSKSYTIKP